MGKMLRKNMFYIMISFAIVMFFSVSLFRSFDNNEIIASEIRYELEEPVLPPTTEDEEILFVDVKGAVQRTGVIEMKRGDRVVDAIVKANGFREDANSDKVNLAALLEDEMVIYVPSILDNDDSIEFELSTTETNKVNINKASVDQLTQLSGIGPSKAQAIITYREENGNFKSVDDLEKVSGIGKKTVERIRDMIVVK